MKFPEQGGGGAAPGGRGDWLLAEGARSMTFPERCGGRTAQGGRGRGCWLLLALLLAACGGDSTGPELPGGATSQPKPGADDVSVATTVRITFPRDVQLPSDTANAIWLEQDGGRVAVQVRQTGARELVLTPIDVLNPAASYTVHLGTGLTDTQGVVHPAASSSPRAGCPSRRPTGSG